jgi:hypothetical protein
MVNSYLRYVEAHDARACVEVIDTTTGCGYNNPRGGVMAHCMGVSRGNRNNYSKSNSK